MTETIQQLDPKEQAKLEKETYDKLRADFPLECYSIDSSRGFDLTSLKAQYISIRLNEVLGFSNWYFDGKFEDENGSLFSGALTIQIGSRMITRKAYGFSGSKKNIGDQRKSAMTDSLSKCSSYFGIGEKAFCGLVDPNEVRKASKKLPTAKKIPSFSKNKPKTDDQPKGW